MDLKKRRRDLIIKILSNSLKKDIFKDEDIVCYCFGYTKKDIKEDYLNNKNRSTILEKIASEKKAGRCDCFHKNPKGM